MMKNAKNLTPIQADTLKGVLAISAVFSLGIGLAALYFKRKHEDALDKVERDTARICLDVAAEHYEQIIRRYKQAAEASSKPEHTEQSNSDFPQPDSYGKHEPSEEEWALLEEELARQRRKSEELLRKIDEQRAMLDSELERVRVKILSEQAVAHCNEQAPDPDASSSQSRL